jgi:hypothetical protein
MAACSRCGLASFSSAIVAPGPEEEVGADRGMSTFEQRRSYLLPSLRGRVASSELVYYGAEATDGEAASTSN